MAIYNLSPSRQECHKHSYLGWSSAFHRLVTSVITVLSPWAPSSSIGMLGSTILQDISLATSPIEAVTVSIYVMLVASSQCILVDVIMVMAGLTKRPGGIRSWGTLMVTHGGWPPVKDWVISLKPGGGSFGGSSREGSGIGDSCSEVEVESPCPLLLCSSIQWCWALLLLELWLWQCHLMLPKLEGTCPTGVMGQDECICVQPGSSYGGDSFTFLSVSGGVDEVASSLVSSVIGSPEAVAGTPGSSADGVTSFSGDVAGLLSGIGVCVVSNVLSSVAPSSMIPGLGVVPPEMAPSVKVVKGLMASHECISPKGAVHQALAGWPFLPNIVGPGIC